MMNCIKIKIIFLVIYCIQKFPTIIAEDEIIDCTNDELVTSIFNDPIDLTLRGIIKIYENVTINELLTTSNNEFEEKYIDARLETTGNETNATKNLIIFTTDKFENYAREQTAARISLKISLGCGMGKERILVFFQPLKEGNYYSPIFSQDLYEFSLPTPIFVGFDLTALLEITAKDDDLTNNQIVFTSNDSSQYHISVGTKNITSDDKKTYFANITLEKIYLELPQQIEFKIIATDNGEPPKSSSASIVIRSDPNRSLPPQPKFVQSVYKGLIDIDFEMQPILVQLINGTYTTDVKFSLDDVNNELFQLVDYENGSLQIVWNTENLNITQILQQKSWQMIIKAQHKDLAEYSAATVLVELADFQQYFHFMSTYYEGLIDEEGHLQILPIIFNPSIYKPDIEFYLLENPHGYFNLTSRTFNIELLLTQNFSLDTLNTTEGFLKLPLQAAWETLSSLTYIVIKLPQLKNTTEGEQMFQFEKPLYVGRLNETYDLELETILLQTDVNIAQQIEYNLGGNGSSLFTIVPNENQLKIEANAAAILNFENCNSSFLLVLEAKNGDLSTYTSLVIMVPPHQIQSLKKKIFTTSWIMGKLLNNSGEQNLSLELIFLNDVENLQNYTFQLEGDESLNFDVKPNLTSHVLELVLKTPLPDNILDSKSFLNLSIFANLTGSELHNDTLLIVIELPDKECPLPNKPLPSPPQFSNTNYVFTAYTNQTGSLGVVNAFSNGTNATFSYILEVASEILAQKLSINPFTGELMLYGTIEEGNYLFNITAENVETFEKAHVKALLQVQPVEECKLYEGVAVEKTLIIQHIDEESPFHGLINMKFNENCTFHIEEMWPNDKEYVYINENFYMLDAIAVDREDPIFANMSEAQITIKLRLKCDTEDSVHSLDIEIPKIESRGSQVIITDDIDYSPDVMWLHIKIDDINDNGPEFKLNEGPQYLGYPSGDASIDIYPEYLTQIKAFDRDLGFNAKIKYSIRENNYFNIEPETGKIYPTGKMLSKDQQTELIILAADQDGEGLTSGTVVIVKALTPNFYSLITIKENTTKSIEEIEKRLSQETGYDMNVIKMSYVPKMDKRASDANGLICKAWIYAFKSHQLVQCKELKEQILDKTPDASIVNIESYPEVALQSPPKSSNSDLGYIIAVSILSVISASAIIFIFWRFYYYPTLSSACDTLTVANHFNGQQICGECSHGADNIHDCIECTNQRNNVKFNDLVERVTVEECQPK